MNQKNTKKLYKKYPKLFIQKDYSIQESCMPWGFECGDGWFWLIDQLCDCIQDYIDSNYKPQVEVTQVKEKLGCLDFNIYNGDELIFGMIWFTNQLSSGICEICGSNENITQSKRWIKTRCINCYDN